MTECNVCLHCRVSAWVCHRDISVSDTSIDEKLLSLTGETEFRGFIDKIPFDIRVISGPRVGDDSDARIFELNEAMNDYDIPQNVSALIPVTENQFDDLRQCMLHSSKIQESTVSVSLTIEGLQKMSVEEETILPIEGRRMEIVNFAWQLSYEGTQ